VGLVEEMFREGFRRFAERIAALERTDDPLADLAALGAAFRPTPGPTRTSTT